MIRILLTAALVWSAAEATAQTRTWSGVLVDAKCANGLPASSAAPDSTAPANEGGSRGSQAVRDRMTGEQWQRCRATRATTKFALLLNDGRFLKLDASANARAATLLRRATASTKPAHAEIKGALQNGMLTAEAMRVDRARTQ